VVPQERANDFFFLDDEQEEAEYGAQSGSKNAADLASQIVNQKKPTDKVSQECQKI
jgi:hypothetical protein